MYVKPELLGKYRSLGSTPCPQANTQWWIPLLREAGISYIHSFPNTIFSEKSTQLVLVIVIDDIHIALCSTHRVPVHNFTESKSQDLLFSFFPWSGRGRIK